MAAEDDDMDLTVCHFDPKHTVDRVPSARILHYGPDDFMPACPECASFFEDTDPKNAGQKNAGPPRPRPRPPR